MRRKLRVLSRRYAAAMALGRQRARQIRNPAEGARPGFEAPPLNRGKEVVNKIKTKRLSRVSKMTLSAPRPRKYILRLYVAGATARSRQAILRARQLCEAELKDNVKLEVIDIYQQPKLARKNQIVAPPTLIMEFPPPLRRFIGNLANITGLFVELDLIKKVKIAL
jgi:circadian clock protein KaiB